MPQQMCLACGYVTDAQIDALTGLDVGKTRTTQPKRLDITICVNCGHAMQFGPGKRFIEISEREWKVIMEDAELMAIIKGARLWCARATGRDLTKPHPVFRA